MPITESPTRTLRVLLVDDDEPTREGYAEYCRCEGLDACTAASGEAALALIRSNPPDVVVLDYSMPGMNGIDLLNLLREDPELPSVPVLILSGRDRDLQSVHGAPWLRKPVEPPQLVDHIRRIVVEAAENHSR